MSEPLIQTPGVFGENENFLLERELGTGGMGGVYMGRDKMLDRPVAVKVMLKEYGDDPEFVEKFKKEAQSVARLIHPNIAQIYSYGICNGMPYMAMELVTGGSLYSIMNASKGKTDVTRVIKICQQVAQALQCASDQGYVHGDVKPENVLLDATVVAQNGEAGFSLQQFKPKVRGSLHAEALVDALHQCIQGTRLRMEYDVTRLDTRQVNHIVHQLLN